MEWKGKNSFSCNNLDQVQIALLSLGLPALDSLEGKKKMYSIDLPRLIAR